MTEDYIIVLNRMKWEERFKYIKFVLLWLNAFTIPTLFIFAFAYFNCRWYG